MTLPPVRLLVFDMDGVLTDSSGCHARAYQDLWAHIALQDPPPYPEIAGRPTGEVVRERTAALRPTDRDVAEWVRFKQERARRYLQDIAPFPDVRPALEALRQRGFRMALATSASRDTTGLLLHRMGLGEFFPVQVAAEDVTRGKPDPESYQRAIGESGGEADTTLVIEDSASGLEAGARSGAWVVSLRTGLTLDHPRFAGPFPDLQALVTAVREPAP